MELYVAHKAAIEGEWSRHASHLGAHTSKQTLHMYCWNIIQCEVLCWPQGNWRCRKCEDTGDNEVIFTIPVFKA